MEIPINIQSSQLCIKANLWKSCVFIQVFTYSFPEPLECWHRPGKIDRGKLGVASHHLAEHGAVRGEEVDKAVRETCLLEDLIDEIV